MRFVGDNTIGVREGIRMVKSKKALCHAELVSAPHQDGIRYTGLLHAYRRPCKREYPVGCRNNRQDMPFKNLPNSCGDNINKGGTPTSKEYNHYIFC